VWRIIGVLIWLRGRMKVVVRELGWGRRAGEVFEEYIDLRCGSGDQLALSEYRVLYLRLLP
jgi:hypothetical protein